MACFLTIPLLVSDIFMKLWPPSNWFSGGSDQDSKDEMAALQAPEDGDESIQQIETSDLPPQTAQANTIELTLDDALKIETLEDLQRAIGKIADHDEQVRDRISQFWREVHRVTNSALREAVDIQRGIREKRRRLQERQGQSSLVHSQLQRLIDELERQEIQLDASLRLMLLKVLASKEVMTQILTARDKIEENLREAQGYIDLQNEVLSHQRDVERLGSRVTRLGVSTNLLLDAQIAQVSPEILNIVNTVVGTFQNQIAARVDEVTSPQGLDLFFRFASSAGDARVVLDEVTVKVDALTLSDGTAVDFRPLAEVDIVKVSSDIGGTIHTMIHAAEKRLSYRSASRQTSLPASGDPSEDRKGALERLYQMRDVGNEDYWLSQVDKNKEDKEFLLSMVQAPGMSPLVVSRIYAHAFNECMYRGNLKGWEAIVFASLATRAAESSQFCVDPKTQGTRFFHYLNNYACDAFQKNKPSGLLRALGDRFARTVESRKSDEALAEFKRFRTELLVTRRYDSYQASEFEFDDGVLNYLDGLNGEYNRRVWDSFFKELEKEMRNSIFLPSFFDIAQLRALLKKVSEAKAV